MTWLEEVINALESLGGVAHYSEIYDYIEKNTSRDLPSSWKDIIRKIIEDHSSDSNNFKSKKDIFYSVKGLGKGVWGLRSELVDEPKSEDFFDYSSDSPERIKKEVYRVIRDTNLTKKIKRLYKDKCQICGLSIRLKEKTYSEAHHIKPLGNKHKGPDSPDNIIILCPNHHVEFDYGVIAIDPDSFIILHKDPENLLNGKKLFLHSKHKLNKDFLRYHLENIFLK